jgi:hypothetical protein
MLTYNWSTCQSVKSTNGQLIERLIWSLFKTIRTNLVTFQTLWRKKQSFKTLKTNRVFNPKLNS